MNNDLIHRSAALAVLEELKNHVASPDPVGEVADAIETMRKVQAVDAESARHGRWIEIEESATGHLMECSVCKDWIFHNFNYASNYCPNCGAKMDLEVTDET